MKTSEGKNKRKREKDTRLFIRKTKLMCVNGFNMIATNYIHIYIYLKDELLINHFLADAWLEIR